MTSLLHISSSPRGEVSESLALAETFLTAYRDANPDVPVDTYDLWDGSLPPFGPDATHAKMAVFGGVEQTDAQAAAWASAEATFRRFDAADHYLFSVPMWNAGIPYILKQFIDVVSQPGLVFGFDPAVGYSGLLTGKKATVIYTSAVYGPGRPAGFGDDHQVPYLTSWLNWAGVSEVSAVEFRPNMGPSATTDRERAHAEARDLAKSC